MVLRTIAQSNLIFMTLHDTHLFVLLTGALQQLQQTVGQHCAEILTQGAQNTRGADWSVAHTLRGSCLHHNRNKGMSNVSVAAKLALPCTFIVT